MDVNVNEVIKVCLGMGMFVSINQRLDAEAITVIADEFGFDVEFLSKEEEEISIDAGDDEADLKHRAPIVTIMGHVDHGKTSLLDYIRDASVAKGEAGGITQHIGAYEVRTKSGQPITFLDTPGHEAFTAMRARGAKVTDIAIIVVAADDSVMPQTKEAINHAQAAGVPIIIALNKIDKSSANPEKIREELSAINILVEEWGGKYQSQEVSAKSGIGIEELLEKVLLEAELLDLKANPDRGAIGTVIEASLDKGRGYVTTVLVQTGTLNVGDIILAGPHFGRVKAMTDHRGKKMKTAPPATPVQVLGLTGAPQAGDRIQVMETEREARETATQRLQLAREQTIRTKKHITLDEIGRRLAIGSFKELNILVKGDVDARWHRKALRGTAAGAHGLVHHAALVKARRAAVHVLGSGPLLAEKGTVLQAGHAGGELGQVKIATVGVALHGVAGHGQAVGGAAYPVAAQVVVFAAPAADVYPLAVIDQEGSGY
nr:translation initiation factor IF-2 [Hymenobacter lapidarius]